MKFKEYLMPTLLFSQVCQEGTYIVEALSDVSGCSVYLPDIIIEIEATDPIISIEERIPNTNCGNSFANGSVEVSVDNSADLSLYTFNWYEGNGTTTPLGTTIGNVSGNNGEIANELTGGSYTVEAFNNATQLLNDPNFHFKRQSNSDFSANKFLSYFPQLQDVIFNDSEATVTSVFENGILADTSDYTFRMV